MSVSVLAELVSMFLTKVPATAAVFSPMWLFRSVWCVCVSSVRCSWETCQLTTEPYVLHLRIATKTPP